MSFNFFGFNLGNCFVGFWDKGVFIWRLSFHLRFICTASFIMLRFQGMAEFLDLIKGGKNARSRPKLDSDY